MAKRYEPDPPADEMGGGMVETTDGDWVRWEDYEALQKGRDASESRACEEALTHESLLEEVERYRERFLAAQGEASDLRKLYDAAFSLAEHLSQDATGLYRCTPAERAVLDAMALVADENVRNETCGPFQMPCEAELALRESKL